MSVYLQHARLSTRGPCLTPVRKQLHQRQSKSGAWHVWCVLKHNALWKHSYALPMQSLALTLALVPLLLCVCKLTFIPVLYFFMLTHRSDTANRWKGLELQNRSICCIYTTSSPFYVYGLYNWNCKNGLWNDAKNNNKMPFLSFSYEQYSSARVKATFQNPKIMFIYISC